MRSTLYQRIRQILESARLGVARTVNTTQVCANWLIGREIVEQEQRGKRRAGYGERLITSLSAQITREFGSGYSVNNLEHSSQLLHHLSEIGDDPNLPRAAWGIAGH